MSNGNVADKQHGRTEKSQLQLNVVVEARPRIFEDLAHIVFLIPGVVDSQVYGLIFRQPIVFSLSADPTRVPRRDTCVGSGSFAIASSLPSEVDELRGSIYVQIQRLDRALIQSPAYNRLVVRIIQENNARDIPHQFIVTFRKLINLDWNGFNTHNPAVLIRERDMRPWNIVLLLHTFLTGHTADLPRIFGISCFSAWHMCS